MKQSTEIRPAREADMEAVGRLYTDSWQRTYRGLIPDWVWDEMTPEKSRDKWTLYRERKENGLFVLERGRGRGRACGLPPLPGAGEQRPAGLPPCGPRGPGGAAGVGGSSPGRPGGPGRAGFGSWSFLWSRHRRAEQLYRGMGG